MIDSENVYTADLERFRGYLYFLAGRHGGRRLQGRFDASDVVQQTLVQALAALSQFRGTSDAEFAAWLRQILARQLANAVRDLGREKRDITRERSLEAALDQSASRLEGFLAVADSSPSHQAQRNEQLLGLAEALAQLPEAQREAIVLHHLEQKSLEEIGLQMDRSTAAVAGLIKRGLRALRLRLQEPA